MGAAPMLAPLAGAQLLAACGWRSIFWVLAACGALTLTVVRFVLAESLDAKQAKRSSIGAALLLAAYSDALGLAGLLAPLFGFVAVLGFIGPNTSAGAMAGNAAQAGSASALLGTLRFAIATVAGTAVGLFSDGTAHAMGLVMAVCGVASLLLYRVLARSADATVTLH